MWGNVLVLVIVIGLHLMIIHYIRQHRHVCATCPVRPSMLSDIRASLK